MTPPSQTYRLQNWETIHFCFSICGTSLHALANDYKCFLIGLSSLHPPFHNLHPDPRIIFPGITIATWVSQLQSCFLPILWTLLGPPFQNSVLIPSFHGKTLSGTPQGLGIKSVLPSLHVRHPLEPTSQRRIQRKRWILASSQVSQHGRNKSLYSKKSAYLVNGLNQVSPPLPFPCRYMCRDSLGI